MKLIRKVELIVGEVKTRLIHMEKQTEELIAYGEQTEEEPAPEIPSTLNSCKWFPVMLSSLIVNAQLISWVVFCRLSFRFQRQQAPHQVGHI